MSQARLALEDARSAKVERQTVGVAPSFVRSPWLCVRAVVGRETFAQQNIEALGHACYLPKYERMTSHARRHRIVQRAFFPGYLFVDAGLRPGVAAAINRSRGVLAVVGGASGEVRVPEKLIEELRTRENPAGLLEITATSLQPGQKVQIVAGPCTGVTAIVAESNDERRATILIDLLGKKHAVCVPTRVLDVAI